MKQSHKNAAHPGAFVREKIIPSGMSITDAGRRLGITRAGLYNFLNGKSSLSSQMAAGLAEAFGADEKRLVDMQAAYDRQDRHWGEKQIAVRAFTPSFLTIKARQIEDWAAKDITARSHLPVLLRKLVHSTSDQLHRVDFPGYDSSQRQGLDGFVDAGAATPWVPIGQSCWEFGTNEKPIKKADSDYAFRLKSISPAERRISTFVFVTPRNWPGKATWERKKIEAGEWKSVRAYDASDLEQWLEQSVPAQTWLAERLELGVDGVETLEQAWVRWAHGSAPRLTPEVFTPAIATDRNKFKDWLERPSDRPFVVAADSSLEALAFLACIFDDPALDPSKKDLAAVFTDPKLLRTLVASGAPFIPIVHSAATERQLAGAYQSLHCIIFRHRNAVEPNADIELKLLRDEDFRLALSAMGVDDSRFDRLARESGHSPTILRRRLSNFSAIRQPEWASDNDTVTTLVPLALIGALHSDVSADQAIISKVGDRRYEEIERELRLLLESDDSPVWSSGRYLGVASKIDALFAVARGVTKADLERFFEAAETVLSEPDPALELPEEARWAAALYGKERKHSDVLRDGVCETLVLLSVHGNQWFQRKLGINVEARVATLIHKLLKPLTVEKLLSHREFLPLYAEAAPDAFLTILEEDRTRDEPVVMGLLAPTGGDLLAGGWLRSGLLWALECLAWNPKTLVRVARILAWLSRTEIDDNTLNKPAASLKAILGSRMPQTAATLPQRLATLKRIVEEFPDVAWKLCFDDINWGLSFVPAAYRPRWRNDASGVGQVATVSEICQSLRQASDYLIKWPTHNHKTLGDLVEILGVLPERSELRIWKVIDEWSRESGEGAKAALRERIRHCFFTPYGVCSKVDGETRTRARQAYESLRAEDPVVRHGWLFAGRRVQVSAERTEAERFDALKQFEEIGRQRREAMIEIWPVGGFAGIRQLLSRSDAPSLVGHHAALSASSDSDRLEFIRQCLAIEGGLCDPAERCLKGFLSAFSDDLEATLLRAAADELDGKERKRLFTLAPFQASTWRLLDEYGNEIRDAYWRGVAPPPGWRSIAELTEAVDCLLDARRPGAALAAAGWSIKDVETSRLKRMLFDLACVDAKPADRHLIQPHDVCRAIDALDGRAGVTPEIMAQLEFLFVGALDQDGQGIPNLEALLADSAELFVQMVVFTSRRRDGLEDPREWRIEDPARKQALASSADRVLAGSKRIPGMDDSGKIQSEVLREWIAEVQRLCRKCGRIEIGDQVVGKLLARAPKGQDGDWPCEAVCQVMESIASPNIDGGFQIGVYTSRGWQRRGEGGLQERELAAKYRATAGRLHFEYPNVGRVIEGIARYYDHRAEWWDSEAEKNKRLHQ